MRFLRYGICSKSCFPPDEGFSEAIFHCLFLCVQNVLENMCSYMVFGGSIFGSVYFWGLRSRGGGIVANLSFLSVSVSFGALVHFGVVLGSILRPPGTFRRAF